MNLEKLSVGMRVPNYRKLCDLLGEPIEAGNSKKAQFRKWDQFFSYQREGNAFIITEIFDAPKPVDDRRMKYAQNLIPVLQHHLALLGTVEQSFSRWFVALGMADGALYDEEKREDVRFYSGLSPFQMQKLVCMTDSVCKRTLLNTLTSLQKDQIISYAVKEYVVTGTDHHLATPEEHQQIQHCKDQAMAAVGVSSMYAIHINPARRIRFYETLNDLYNQQFGWDRTYTLLEITPLNTEEVSTYQSTDIKPMMDSLNSSIKSAVIAQLRAECEQADRKCMEEWENDATTTGFKLDRMTAEMLIHVLKNEI